MNRPPLVVDGAHGEGGGQIVRTALTFSAITGRAVRIENVRAGRARPGLAAQHLTAVRAAATLCDAAVEGDTPGSTRLSFAPRGPARAGAYAFDVSDAREGGSAGAAGLVLQTVLLPLALASGPSTLELRGGTHLQWSPSFDYLDGVWAPALAGLGIDARIELRVSGWFPVGRGEIAACVSGRSARAPVAMTVVERGPLLRITGRALAANLPGHVPRRMAQRAQDALCGLRVPIAIAAVATQAACPGAGLFLVAQYRHARAGFGALGRRGRPAERVADDACEALLSHRASGAALDMHLADQILVPLALAAGRSRFSVERITSHLRTNAWLIERFGLARVELVPRSGGAGDVTVTPSS